MTFIISLPLAKGQAVMQGIRTRPARIVIANEGGGKSEGLGQAMLCRVWLANVAITIMFLILAWR